MKFCEKYTDINYIKSDDCRKTITLKDKGGSNSTYICSNNYEKRIIVYIVDNGIIKSQTTAKCDFALYNAKEDVIYFIELKGSNYDRAIEQIESAINNLIRNNHISINSVNARIVLTRAKAPQINTTKEIKLKKILATCKGNLKKATTQLTENI
jgi:hypothetical protein